MTRKKEEVPEEDEAEVPVVNSDTMEQKEVPEEDEDAKVPAADSDAVEQSDTEEKDEEEAVVEDVSTDDATNAQEAPKKMKTVDVEEWSRLNSQPPLWTRYAQVISTYTTI
jgi:heat shock protein beta